MKGLPSPSNHAAGTGPHGHRRAVYEQDGTRVAFWVCRMGTPPLRHCPSDPDPILLWAEKHLRPFAPEVDEPAEDDGGCRNGHGPGWWSKNAKGYRFCTECRRETRNRARVKARRRAA